MKIPFLPMRAETAVSLSKPFLFASKPISRFFPFLPVHLSQLEYDVLPEEYVGACLLGSTINAAAISLVFFGIANKLEADGNLKIYGTLLLGAGIMLSFFIYSVIYTKWLVSRRTVELDKDLLFAFRHLRVQTSAGVPLFDSLISVSRGYGEVSREIGIIVKEVQGGVALADSIEESARKSPSKYYRRILWQLANASRSGAKVGPILTEAVSSLADDQKIELKKYGAQLNPLSLFYMITCIIVPTMSLIFLIVVSSLASIPITEQIFMLILVFLSVFQFIFIGMIESRRPRVSI